MKPVAWNEKWQDWAEPPGRRSRIFLARITRDRDRSVREVNTLLRRHVYKLLGNTLTGSNVLRCLLVNGRPDEVVRHSLNVTDYCRAYFIDPAHKECEADGRQVIEDFKRYRALLEWREQEVNERHLREARKLINRLRSVYRETSKNDG